VQGDDGRTQFDDDARLDTSDVQDGRGSRIPGGRATVGGGIAGLIALILGAPPRRRS